MNLDRQLLLSRFLTRSGDQAWDFALPLALLHTFPGRLQVAAFYYFLVKLGTFIGTPAAGRWIDAHPRLKVLRYGIVFQALAVFGGGMCFYFIDQRVHDGYSESDPASLILGIGLVLFGVLASLGSLITDISVGLDVAPSVVPTERLTAFNSWLRRLDLGTEVGSPIVAGLLLAWTLPQFHLWGLALVAAWNLISFAPEYWLLSGILQKASLPAKVAEPSTWRMLFRFRFVEALRTPLFLLLLSYALLWFSVLSPHGVLLTGYLKDQMRMPEIEIGIFRGLGAFFGLISTLTFPAWVQKRGLISGAKAHLIFQAGVLVVGLLAFESGRSEALYVFLVCILFSRIGLYGFSNGEFELRQRKIAVHERGTVNALSSFLTSFATLLLFAVGSLLQTTAHFRYLVHASVGAVILSSVLFWVWTRKQIRDNVQF